MHGMCCFVAIHHVRVAGSHATNSANHGGTQGCNSSGQRAAESVPLLTLESISARQYRRTLPVFRTDFPS